MQSPPPLSRAMSHSPAKLVTTPDVVATKKGTEDTWIGSLAKVYGPRDTYKIMQCVRIEWKQSAKPTSIIHFSGAPGDAATKSKQAFPLSKMINAEEREKLLSPIILGAAGGTFTSEGVKVRVRKFVSESGQIKHVDCELVDDDGKALGALDRMEIEQFISSYAKEPEPTPEAASGTPSILSLSLR